MTLDSWLPFGKQHDPQNLYSALHDGVPEWMGKALRAWQYDILEVVFGSADKPMRRFHSIEQELRTVITPPQSASTLSLASSVIAHFKSSDDSLMLTDYLLSLASLEKLGGWESLKDAMDDGDHLFGQLESTLRKSGSKWTIGIRAADRVGLVQRVPEGVQLGADEAMRSSGHAGKRLAEAWGAAFGLEPDPAKAYGLAVKSVEDAALPKIPLKPNDHRTLGSVIRELNSTKYDAADWTLKFQREDKHYSNGQTLVAMLKTLWSGQTDRHGGDHEVVTGAAISQAAAEAAVMLAVPLVQWFSSDFVVASGTSTKLTPE
ncbi:hypothetical protein [Arthrobacter sp. EpRS71]|uniref:hypothetical protein n=1 Tax=Arthrobacter sp. EpRS71 TaxID=1743141 RepID=UPI000746A633|nr:hypothetical protein [Arthrobacter sp. EpRS71]KUM40944.1 hypothetical protein AR689_06180 [Arthrobacter sp. EpRS71]